MRPPLSSLMPTHLLTLGAWDTVCPLRRLSVGTVHVPTTLVKVVPVGATLTAPHQLEATSLRFATVSRVVGRTAPSAAAGRRKRAGENFMLETGVRSVTALVLWGRKTRENGWRVRIGWRSV